MALPPDFLTALEAVDPKQLLEMLRTKAWPTGGGAAIELVNEMRPVDLFCYLGARFGPPNGIQSFLREDDSDNLVHWHWTLRHPSGFVSFMGMNFRTEIHFHGHGGLSDKDKKELVDKIKADFLNHGQQMGEVREMLEDWVEFVNPYQRIRRAVSTLVDELDSLGLRPDEERLDDLWKTESADELKQKWEKTASRYSKGFGLCFGIRSMLPVLAEAYINLVIFILMRPEIRSDQRLRDNVFRQPIDVRIKSLPINCVGFSNQPDYSAEPCKRYHTLVNERNDLLHGNVVVEKLKFNEVNFLGKIPIFKEYRNMWQRSLGVEMNAVGLRGVRDEIAIVDALIDYVQCCVHKKLQGEIDRLAKSYELGFNRVTQRLGILFPPWLVDFRVQLPNQSDSADKEPLNDEVGASHPPEA